MKQDTSTTIKLCEIRLEQPQRGRQTGAEMFMIYWATTQLQQPGRICTLFYVHMLHKNAYVRRPEK